jgi:hypothetical protein
MILITYYSHKKRGNAEGVVMEQKSFTVTTPKGILSFPHLFEKYGLEGQEEKWSAQLLLKKGEKEVEDFIVRLKTICKELIADTWPDATKRPKNISLALKDGDTWQGEDGNLKKDKYPEFEGHYIVTCSNKTRRPGVYDLDRSPITDPELIYAGCMGHLSFNATTYNNVKKGVGFWLRGFMKVAEGDPLSGGTATLSDFDDVKNAPASATTKNEVKKEADDFLL